jgi:hypothetical protein
MKMEQTECSETSACTFQTPGNYPEESLQHLEHGKSLKSGKRASLFIVDITLETSPVPLQFIFCPKGVFILESGKLLDIY